MRTIGHFRSADARAAYVRAYEAAMEALPPPTDGFEVRTSFGCVRGFRWEGVRDTSVPVVLLPGRSAGVPMWGDNLPDLLRSERTVIAVDALGDAGLSEQSVPLSTVGDQATWVEETLDGLGVGVVHTLGHSFGAATTAAHALRFPSRVASIGLLEPAFVLRWPPPSTFVWATLSLVPGPSSWREHALAALGGVEVDEVRARTPVGEMISAAVEHFQSDLPTPRPLSREQLGRLTQPVYVAIAGRRSLAGGERAATRARTLPNAVVDVWPGTTHSLPMQVPADLALRLRSFWDRVDPPG